MSQTFQKRSGATDRGRDYEHLFIANIVLKLLIDDNVQDFSISSNDKEFGSFDDVVITINYSNQRTTTYALQLKQSKNHILRTNDFGAPKGNYSISKYFEDFTKNLRDVNCTLILYTNCKPQLHEEVTLSDDKKLKISTIEGDELLKTNPNGRCFKFESEDNDLEEFLRNFRVYATQADVDRLEKLTLRLFKEIFKSDEYVFNEFVHFVVNWSVKEGRKEMLVKRWMQDVVALRVLSPFIKPLVMSPSPVTKKEVIFRQAVAEFEVTILSNDSYDKVKTLWRDKMDLDLPEANKLKKKYQIVLDTDDRETSKLLWLLSKTPLVVEECPGFSHLFKFCRIKNIILLQDHATVNLPHFQNLADLKLSGSKVYDSILNTFTFSLEGQKEASLQDLMALNFNFVILITTDHLVQALEVPLVFGRSEVLPLGHVPRTFWNIVIDPKFLHVSNAVTFVSGVENFELFRIKMYSNKTLMLSVEMTNLLNFTRGVVYVSKEFCNFKLKNLPCHYFRYRDNYLEWISSTTSTIENLKQYRLDHEYTNPVPESEVFEQENEVNLVCGNSGMGKTTLMQSLKASKSSSVWTILIYARNHARYCETKPNVCNFLEHLWTRNCQSYDQSERKIFKMFVQKQQVRIIWDGLDEVSPESLKDILSMVELLAAEGVKQWLTARNNLKPVLETRFQTFSRRIRQFDGQEQRLFIQRRLRLSDEELLEVVRKIGEPFSNSDVLGIPLQLYMLTELLERDVRVLDGSFTMLDLYEHFVRNKFLVYHTVNLNMDLSIERNSRKFEDDMKSHIDNYKRVAFNLYCGGTKFFSYLQARDDFLKTVQERGDPVGFISEVEDDPKFVHNSFGEFFAALYLFEYDPFRAKDSKFVRTERYNNIRFFLDLMIVKTSKAHIAVLFKNSTLLEECTDLDEKDQIDRGTLELACAWSREYDVAKIQKLDFGRFNIHSKYVCDDSCRRLQYSPIARIFGKLDVSDPRLRKLFLLLPFLIPLYSKNEEECIPMLIYYSIIFDHVAIFKYIESHPVLKRSYNNFDPKYLLSAALIYQSHNCLQKFVLKKQYQEALRHDLNILLYTCRGDNEDMFSLLAKNVVKKDRIVAFACWNGSLKNVEFLLRKRVAAEYKGRSLLHFACDNEVDGFNIVNSLIRRGGDVNSVDARGRLPLHYACMNDNFAYSILRLLIGNESKINAEDANKRTPLHYACDNEEDGFQVASFLVWIGAKLDVADIRGRLPIHYACMNWKFGFKLVELLVNNVRGCKMDATDQNGCAPLHYACKNHLQGFQIVQLLIQKGVPINVANSQGELPVQYACESGTTFTADFLIERSDQSHCLHSACRNYFNGPHIVGNLIRRGFDVHKEDDKGRTPLHIACKHSKPETVKLLVANGATVNAGDHEGNLPIHFACKNLYDSAEIVRILLKENVEVNMADQNGRLPLHIACEKSSVYTVVSIYNRMKKIVRDAHGRLPIHYACLNFNNGYHIVKFLTSDGAVVNIGDKNGRTPMHYACQTGNIYIVSLLIEMGAKVEVEDEFGWTPLDYAKAEDNHNVVALLK